MTEEIDTFPDENDSLLEENDSLPKEAERFFADIEKRPTGSETASAERDEEPPALG